MFPARLEHHFEPSHGKRRKCHSWKRELTELLKGSPVQRTGNNSQISEACKWVGSRKADV
jgi:hypothetical protein